MNRCLVLTALFVVGALPAQGQSAMQAPRPEEQRRELLRRQDQSEQELQRLLDMRLRHDLGLIRELDDAMIRTAEAATTTMLDRRRAEVEEENAKTQILQVEYEKVRRAVERLQAMVAEAEDEDETLTVPRPGRRVARSSIGVRRRGGDASRPPAAPGPESVAGGADVVEGALALDPLRAQIHGSKDHQRVAQALFKAGQALMDRARELRDRGEIEAAATLDERARESRTNRRRWSLIWLLPRVAFAAV